MYVSIARGAAYTWTGGGTDETFTVTLSNPTHATLDPDQTVATVTITDDDRRGSGNQVPLPPGPGPLTTTVVLLSPNGRERFLPGESIQVEWLTVGRADLVNLRWTNDGGTTWHPIVEGRLNSGIHLWTPPPEAEAERLFVRVEATDLATVYAFDMSDAPFAIGEKPAPAPEPEEPEEPTPPRLPPILPDYFLSPVTQLFEEVARLAPRQIIRAFSWPTVYFVTEDLTRRFFFNPAFLRSWGWDFADVDFVTDATVAVLETDEPMSSKPGTVLVKEPSSPEVFFLAPHPDDPDQPFLRLIPGEGTALQLFGLSWADHVIDVPVSLLQRWEQGEPMSPNEPVDRSLLRRREELERN